MADILEPEDKDRLYENLLVGQSKVSAVHEVLTHTVMCNSAHLTSAIKNCMTNMKNVTIFANVKYACKKSILLPPICVFAC